MALHRTSIYEVAFVMRVGRRLQELFELVDGKVEEKIVHVSRRKVELSDELRSNGWPVLLGVYAQVISVIAHVVGDVAVDCPGQLVPERHGVAVIAHRTVDRLPGLELVSGPTAAPEDCLEATQCTHRDQRMPIGRPLED